MKVLTLICASLLIIGIFKLPIGYYTFLRIIVTIGAITIIIKEFNIDLNFWIICFGIIAILFNPIIPIHLNSKSAWIPIDLVAGLIFLIKAFLLNTNKIEQNEKD